MSQKQTIIDIFNEMNIEDKISDDLGLNEKIPNNMVPREGQKIMHDEEVINMMETSVEAQKIWKATSLNQRAKILYNIGNALLGTEIFKEGAQYFEYYSDLLIVRRVQNLEESVNKIICVKLPQNFPRFIFCSAVAAILAHGSSVLILTDSSDAFAFQNIIEKLDETLPTGLYAVMPKSSLLVKHSENKVNHLILFAESFSDLLFSQNICLHYICPHNTSAILLESCDLSAAISKIVMETWGENSSLWGVSTLVVQESIYQKFVEKIKIQLERFTVNKNYKLSFKNSLDQFNKLIESAKKKGGKIIQQTAENNWSPTVVLQCQDQCIDSAFLILKVVTCRTATEGVSLLNNTRYGLGTSIWTEISSEALEIASELNCLNIWVNCHGCFSADKPLRSIKLSGNFTCGGVEGLMQFEDTNPTSSDFKETLKELDEKNLKIDPSKRQILNSSIVLSFEASQSWRHNKNRKRIIKHISNLFIKNNLALSDVIDFYSHSTNISDHCENFCETEFFTIQQPVPFGVIAIIIVSTSRLPLIALLTSALVLGNTVIITVTHPGIHNSELLGVLEIFKNNLPKNVLHILQGEDSAEFLTCDPTIQEFWLRDEHNESEECLKKIVRRLNWSLKRYWMTPKIIPESFPLLCRKCLQQKIIWLPKVDKFP